MQTLGPDRSPDLPAAPGSIGWDGFVGAPAEVFAGAAQGQRGRLASLWSNEKTRHGIIAGAGILVVCIGVAIALLAGGGKPAAESMGEALARSYDSYAPTGDASRRPPTSSASQSTTPPAGAATAVGDTTTQPRSSASPYKHPDDDGDRPDGSVTAAPMVCPGTDARCGPFRWEPAPGPNAELTLSVKVGGNEVANGAVIPAGLQEALQLEVAASDPDSWIGTHQCWTVTGPEGFDNPLVCSDQVDLPPWMAGKTYTYGAVPPPAPEPGTYASGPLPLSLPAGTYTFEIKVASGGDPACGLAPNLVRCTPYASEAAVSFTLEVT